MSHSFKAGPNCLPLAGGGCINGPVHTSNSGTHIDVYNSAGRKYHVPFEGQTTLDMFDRSKPKALVDQLNHISSYGLGTFNADKSK